MSYRLRFSAALDKENKTHHLHFITPAKGLAPIAENPSGALEFQCSSLAPTCTLVEMPPRSLCRRLEAMAKRDDYYKTSSSGCSNGIHKRLLQVSSGGY
jgi:hypothetical protein